MAMKRSAWVQRRFLRIFAVLILASQATAQPQSGRDEPDVIRVEDSSSDGRESPLRNASTSFVDAASCIRRHSTTLGQDRYTLTPQVGLHLIHTHAKTWHQARNICREEGGDLAVINSPAESQALAELMAKSLSHYGSEDSNYVLIGFNDIDQEGEYVTIDGRSLNEAGFAEWATNEPGNPGTGENCGSIYKDGRLNDISCEVAYGFACELPMLDQGRSLGDGLIDGGKACMIPGDDATLEQCKKFIAKTCDHDSAGGSSQNSTQRDGRKESPAKTCKDLFVAYPDKPSGQYWMDPNEGDVSDAILVRCDAERSTTCIAPESVRTPNISYSGYEREVWLSEIDDKLQMTYSAATNQIIALQGLSNHAEQNVTYHCIKSVGYFDSEGQTYGRGLKLLAWNDVELGPRGSRHFRYDVTSDGCRDRLDEWKETVIVYRTDKPARLPVTDVGLRDVGKPDQSFAVEIGEVCFG